MLKKRILVYMKQAVNTIKGTHRRIQKYRLYGNLTVWT